MPAADFRVREANSEPASRCERLREAVRKAGGNKAVAERSGVPLGTLDGYLSGKGWKVATALALAEACGVSLEWLVTGRDQVEPPRVEAPAPPPSAGPRPLFSIVNVDRMATALETVLELQRASGARPGVRRTVQAMLLVYDDLTEEARAKGNPDAA